MAYVRYNTNGNDRTLKLFDDVNTEIEKIKNELNELKTSKITEMCTDMQNTQSELTELKNFKIGDMWRDIQYAQIEIGQLKNLKINELFAQIQQLHRDIRQIYSLIQKNRDDITDLLEYRKRIDEYYEKNEQIILFNIFKHIEKIIPLEENVSFTPIQLKHGNYLIETQITYNNPDIAPDASVTLGLYANDVLISTSSTSWYGRNNMYSGSQTIFLKGVLDNKNNGDGTEYIFSIKKLHSVRCKPVLRNDQFPCLLTIL